MSERKFIGDTSVFQCHSRKFKLMLSYEKNSIRLSITDQDCESESNVE